LRGDRIRGRVLFGGGSGVRAPPREGVGAGPSVIGVDCRQPSGRRSPPVVAVPSAAVEFTCPRCATAVDSRFYGPCPSCREQLKQLFHREGRVVEVAEYVPKINVTPNAVASKGD